MENLIPLLIVIAVVYRIYSEYQKEQQKARQRTPGRPGIPAPQDAPPFPFPEFGFPEPQEPVVVKRMPVHTETVPKEVRKAVPKKKEEREAIAVERPERPIFDLREAVIQSTILERRF